MPLVVVVAPRQMRDVEPADQDRNRHRAEQRSAPDRQLAPPLRRREHEQSGSGHRNRQQADVAVDADRRGKRSHEASDPEVADASGLDCPLQQPEPAHQEQQGQRLGVRVAADEHQRHRHRERHHCDQGELRPDDAACQPEEDEQGGRAERDVGLEQRRCAEQPADSGEQRRQQVIALGVDRARRALAESRRRLVVPIRRAEYLRMGRDGHARVVHQPATREVVGRRVPVREHVLGREERVDDQPGERDADGCERADQDATIGRLAIDAACRHRKHGPEGADRQHPAGAEVPGEQQHDGG